MVSNFTKKSLEDIQKIEHSESSEAKRVLVINGGIPVDITNSNPLDRYITHDVDDASPITYVGKMDKNGNWLITKITDTSGDLDLVYANVSNNSSYTTYSSAWTDRASLTYADLNTLTINTDTIIAGIDYSVSADIISLSNGSSAYLMGITDSKKVTYTNFELTSDQGDIAIELYEGATTTANGTALNTYDLNRINDSTATMLVYASPTVSVEGTKLQKTVLADTNKKIGGSADTGAQWKFKTATKYLLKITNNSGSTANLTGTFFWREE